MNSTHWSGAIALALSLLPGSSFADGAAVGRLFDALDVVRGATQPPPRLRDDPETVSPGGVPVASAPTAGGGHASCPKLGRLSSIGAVGDRPATYAPSSLWPVNGHCAVHSFRDLQFPEAVEQKRAYTKIGDIPCRTCERGATYDGWPKNMPESKLLSLRQGEPLRWKGARYEGAVVLTGEHPIGPFPCRQYRWTLSEGAKVAAERAGLFCKYQVPGSSAVEWYQVI